MFRCDYCGFTTKPGQKATKVIAETKTVVFPWREKVHDYRYHDGIRSFKVKKDDPGGKGTQIVREASLCPTCAGDTNEIHTN